MLPKYKDITLRYLIPLNIVLLIQTNFIFQVPKEFSHYFFIDFIYVFLLLIIGIVVYIFSEYCTESNLFLLIMVFSGWILMLINHPINTLLDSVVRLLVCLNNILLFVFFSYFFNLNTKKTYLLLLKLLVIFATITCGLLLAFIPIFNYSLLVLPLVTSLFCGILSLKNRHTQPTLYRNHQSLLLLTIATAFVPFVFLRFFTQQFIIVQFSFYSFITLPLSVVYVYLKKNKLKIKLNYSSIILSAVMFVLINGAYISFCLFVLKLTSSQTSNLLLVSYLILYCYQMYRSYVLKRQMRFLNSVKQSFEKERLELLQKITYDNHLDSLSLVVQELIEKTIPLDGHLVIWEEDQKHLFILAQSGVFKEMSLNKSITSQLQKHITSITWKGETYFSFPMFYKKIPCGWIITGSKSNKKSFSKQDMEKLTLLSRSIGELLKTTETLHKNRTTYSAIADTSDVGHLTMQLQLKSDELQKSLALYLHDDILQNIIALKNLSETIETPQTDLKNLIIETLAQLNESLRERMFEIYPSTLMDLRFYDSLSILCDKIKQGPLASNNPIISLSMDSDLEVPSNLRFPLFRIVKELLQNSLKHGQSNSINVTLVSTDKQLLITFEDDGTGMDIKSYVTNKVGTGLLSIKQEINSLKGEFSIDDQREKGVSFQIVLPLSMKLEEHSERYSI